MGIVLVVLLMAVVQLTNAQSYDYLNRKSKLIVGFGSGLSTRSFSILSDIDGLNNMKENQEGWESFFMVGGNGLRLRTGYGAFKNSATETNSIKQSTLSGMVNIYALDLIGKGKKTLHPYLISGVGVSIFEFSGANVPAMPLIFSNPACQCTCPLSGPGLPPPPSNPESTLPINLSANSDLTTQTSETPAVNTAKMTTTQVVTGLGAEASFRKNGYFFSMFGELRYGLPIGLTTQNPTLNNTRIKNSSAITFGIAFGLTNDHKNKGFKSSVR